MHKSSLIMLYIQYGEFNCKSVSAYLRRAVSNPHSHSHRALNLISKSKLSISSKSKHICSSWTLMDPSVCAVCQDPCNHSRYSLVRVLAHIKTQLELTKFLHAVAWQIQMATILNLDTKMADDLRLYSA